MSKFSSPLLNYEKKWVALTNDNKRVLASADTIEDLEGKLKKISSKKFTLTWIPPFDKVLSMNVK